MKPLLIAHRGLHDTFPENSIEALQAALEAGADGIECDVRLADDGQLFLCHDLEVAGKRVSSLSYEERLDAGYTGFQEVLQLMEDWPGKQLFLEAKTVAAAELLLLDTSASHIMISFSDTVVRMAQKKGWDAGYLTAQPVDVLRDLLPPGAFMAPHYWLESYLSDQEVQSSAFWTVNERSIAETLIERKAWAITTDQLADFRSWW